MRFDVVTEFHQVRQGYLLAQAAILDPYFAEQIHGTSDFTYTQASGPDVLYYLTSWISTSPLIPVRDFTYSTDNVVATIKKGDPTIWVNRRAVGKSSAEKYLRNGAHETGHKIGFGHGSNFTQETPWGRMMCKLKGDRENKNFSVPYLFEEFAVNVAKRNGWI